MSDTHNAKSPINSTTAPTESPINRRTFFKTTLAIAGAAALSATPAVTNSLPEAKAQGPILGTVIDYSAGIPKAEEIKAAGHIGAVRYVSHRRPGTERWMVGKPVTRHETDAMANLGMETASVYQFGKDDTADWKQGAAGAHTHAPQAIELHRAAGGPTGRPIYVAIDDNPSRHQYTSQIRPYLQTFSQLLAAAGYSMGVYGNYNTIDWAIADGLGSFFWQHDWGSQGQIHSRTTIHQKAGLQENIGGVTVDVNNVYASDWGQWTPGQPAPTTTGETVATPSFLGISPEQITEFVRALSTLSS